MPRAQRPRPCLPDLARALRAQIAPGCVVGKPKYARYENFPPPCPERSGSRIASTKIWETRPRWASRSSATNPVRQCAPAISWCHRLGTCVRRTRPAGSGRQVDGSGFGRGAPVGAASAMVHLAGQSENVLPYRGTSAMLCGTVRWAMEHVKRLISDPAGLGGRRHGRAETNAPGPTGRASPPTSRRPAHERSADEISRAPTRGRPTVALEQGCSVTARGAAISCAG